MHAMKWLNRVLPNDDGGLNDRPRLYGYTVCFVGAPILLVTIFSIWQLGDASFYLLISGGIALATLLMIGLSSYFNFAVKKMLTAALLITFANVWGIGCWEMLAGDHKQHHLAVLLFIPALVVSLMQHKIVFLLMPIQFGLVYFLSTEYAGKYFSAEFTEADIVIMGAMFAIMSTVSFSMAAITARIRDKNDEKFLSVIEEKKKLSMTDALTGLKNRRAFMEMLENDREQNTHRVLAFVDLDRFKPINDQFGHAAGDDLLSEIAARLSAAPDVAYAARIGGDEFAFVLQRSAVGTDADQTIGRIHRLLTKDIETEAGSLSVGASIGYVDAEDDIDSPDLLLPAAEIAMRRAKQNRSGWTRFDHQVDDATMATAALETAFKKALQRGHIRAALQPIGCARSHMIIGHELLARWVDPEYDQQPRPDQFIPIAEKLGLLNDLLWVTLGEAIKSPEALTGMLSLNVSPAQITATDFISRLVDLLEQSNFPPDRIVLEITEEVAFRNVEQNIEVLNEARRLGMTVALDDFGTGFSSLFIVEKLPLDKLKIDRSLVSELSQNAKSRTILEIALQMASKLGMVSCVEGIEDARTATLVARLGAKEIQGFWLGKPDLVERHSRFRNVA